MREMQAKWLNFMANSRGSNAGKGLCVEFLGHLQFFSQLEVTIPYDTSLNRKLQYLTILLSASSFNTLQYLTQLEVRTIPLPTQ